MEETGQLAQLDRALASGARGRGFESHIVRIFYTQKAILMPSEGGEELA